MDIDFPSSDPQNATTTDKTVAFSSQTASFLNHTTGMGRDFEKDRTAKRVKRTTANLSVGASGTTSTVGTPGGPGTPASQVDKGATAEPKKPPTKKELKKQAESRQTEAEQHKATNQAASLALGGIGGGPSWLKGSGGTKSWLKSSSAVNTSFTPPARMAAAAQNARGVVSTATGDKGEKKFGGFREDAAGNSDIQLRDVVRALELDVKERKVLTSAYAKLNSTKD